MKKFSSSVSFAILGLLLLGCTRSNSYNWAGYIKDSDNGNWRTVYGSFTQPSANPIGAPAVCRQTAEVSWVGLGGDATYDAYHNLAQIGTALTATGEPGQPIESQDLYAWYAVITPDDHDDFHSIAGLTVTGDDTISVGVHYEDIEHTPDPEVIMSIAVNGVSNPAVHVPRGWPGVDGHTAEWIDEAPKITSSGYQKRPNDYAYLTNFDHVSWSDANARDGTGIGTPVPLNAGDYRDVSMWYDIGSRPTPPPLALPDGPSSATSFTNRWTHC
jgi:hypothetical protein